MGDFLYICGMEKEFVPYELDLRMKALGFDEPCLGYYAADILCTGQPREMQLDEDGNYKKSKTESFPIIVAPTYSQAFRWFREKYGLYSWIKLHNGYINDSLYPELPITFSIMDRKTGNESYERDIPHNYLYKTNEEGELACLEKLIEIVEQQKTK
jgi:hypothetical protein